MQHLTSILAMPLIWATARDYTARHSKTQAYSEVVCGKWGEQITEERQSDLDTCNVCMSLVCSLHATPKPCVYVETFPWHPRCMWRFKWCTDIYHGQRQNRLAKISTFRNFMIIIGPPTHHWEKTMWWKTPQVKTPHLVVFKRWWFSPQVVVFFTRKLWCFLWCFLLGSSGVFY